MAFSKKKTQTNIQTNTKKKKNPNHRTTELFKLEKALKVIETNLLLQNMNSKQLVRIGYLCNANSSEIFTVACLSYAIGFSPFSFLSLVVNFIIFSTGASDTLNGNKYLYKILKK